MSVMKVAHSNADYGVMMFGGRKVEYFAMALRLAHRGVDLMGIYIRRLANTQMINERIKTLEDKVKMFDKILDFIFGALLVIVIAVVMSFFSPAHASDQKASHYCTYGEGIESSIILEDESLDSLDSARDMCPEYVVTETKRSDDESCKQELSKVKKIFKNKYECFYE